MLKNGYDCNYVDMASQLHTTMYNYNLPMVFLRQQPWVSPEPTNQAPFARVKAHLKKELSQGRWPPGSLMPSEPKLVAQFQVSRMTVTRALRELQTEGLVTRLQGVGTFSAHLSVVSSNLTIHDLQQEIAARGHRHHAVVHLAQEEACPEGIAQQFRLPPGTLVFHTLLVHYENDEPMQCEDRYVNPACAPDYLQNDFTQLSPTYYLRTVAPLWEAQYSVEACLPKKPGSYASHPAHPVWSCCAKRPTPTCPSP